VTVRFDKAMVDHLRYMAEREGLSSKQMAARIGSTSGSVRVRCAEHGIKIPVHRDGGVRALRGHKAVAYLLPRSAEAVDAEATRRGVSRNKLATMVMEAVVEGKIWNAVLDK
jgi:hypothetical protein